MSSILNVLNDGRNALFALHKASRAELMAPVKTLADKLEEAGLKIDVSARALEGMNVAKTVLEESRAINDPKAKAEERLEKAEARIRELRLLARLYAARGDPVKLAALAREAAAVARQVGKAAGEFAEGMAATTERDETALSSTSASSSASGSTTAEATSLDMAFSSSSTAVSAVASPAPRRWSPRRRRRRRASPKPRCRRSRSR